MTLLRLLAFEPGRDAMPREETVLPAAATPGRSDPSSSAPAAATLRSVTTADAASIAAGSAPDIANWPAFIAAMKLSGITLQLAGQTELKAFDGNTLTLAVPEEARHLTEKAYADKLKAALEQTFGRRVRLNFEIGAAGMETLSAQEKRDRLAQQARTEAAFRDDPFVQDVLSRFDARIKPNSIKPV
jgi:DNA polymerase-3 subunit gamma/tau